MKSLNLAELTKKRQDLINQFKENNFDVSELLGDKLYSESSHFIYEILQNADDAKASTVKFALTSEKLTITHNGKKYFDFNDVESITTAGSSTKEDDINAIGKFGIGFKSVFAITKTPEIRSGEFHFKITDYYILPEEISRIDIGKNTIITLPFDHPKISPDSAYEQISNRIQDLRKESLLFLRHIKKIEWSTESNYGYFAKKYKDNKAILTSQVNEDKPSENKYLLFQKNINIENKQLNIAIAYALNNDGQIEKLYEDTSNLFVFFPTKEVTSFNFLVHAPYKTTPNRETIPFDDRQNEIITSELANLVANSIIGLKEKKLLNINVLSMLPIDSAICHPLYQEAFEQVKQTFTKKALLPTKNSKFTHSRYALLAREKELTNLLDSKNCESMFERKTWLSTDITIDKARDLRNYLVNELEIPEITMQRFCEKITADFMKYKTDKWLIKFYISMVKNASLHNELCRRKIIRLENGEQVLPEGIYLPPKKGILRFTKTIKKCLVTSETKEFLKNIGLQPVDEVAEIKEFIVPKYSSPDNTIDSKEYLDDVHSIIEILPNITNYQQEEIYKLLRSCRFIRCENQMGEITFQATNNTTIYTKTNDLSRWFEGCTDEAIYFIDIGCELTEKIKIFFRKLGISEILKILSGEEPIPPELLYKNMYPPYHDYFYRLYGFNPNIKIDGLEYSLHCITKYRSILLWRLLLDNEPKTKLSGELKTRQYKNRDYTTVTEKSKILILLENARWLYDKKSNLIEKRMSEILLEDLNDDYKKDAYNIEELAEVLGFKKDKVAEFEEKNPNLIVITRDEHKEFEQWKQAKKPKPPVSEWSPEVPIEEAELKIIPYNSDKKPPENWTKENLPTGTSQEPLTPEPPIEDSPNAKEIGKYAEELAEKYLKKQYPNADVIWLNAKGNIGRGCDFKIEQNGEEIAYYEVKSKTDGSPQFFQITGAQWEMAKQLHKEDNGDKYIILVISHVGTEHQNITPIKNPFNLWKSGKLDANPVRIKL